MWNIGNTPNLMSLRLIRLERELVHRVEVGDEVVVREHGRLGDPAVRR